jgi:hypothetical protein
LTTIHTIKQGESTASLGIKHGLLPETIWQHEKNSELRQNRPDMNILLPEDELFIPDLTVAKVTCASDTRHKFCRKSVPALMRMQLLNDGLPHSDVDFELILSGSTIKGTSDREGRIEAKVPPDARKGVLVFGPNRTKISVYFGNLDPIAEISGAQARLNNLGFDCGAQDGKLQDMTRDAIIRFQETKGIKPSGELCNPTKQALLSAHDSTQK